VAIAPHNGHSCLKSKQPTVRVSSSHTTVIIYMLLPHRQTVIGSPRKSNISNDYVLSDTSLLYRVFRIYVGYICRREGFVLRGLC